MSVSCWLLAAALVEGAEIQLQAEAVTARCVWRSELDPSGLLAQSGLGKWGCWSQLCRDGDNRALAGLNEDRARQVMGELEQKADSPHSLHRVLEYSPPPEIPGKCCW